MDTEKGYHIFRMQQDNHQSEAGGAMTPDSHLLWTTNESHRRKQPLLSLSTLLINNKNPICFFFPPVQTETVWLQMEGWENGEGRDIRVPCIAKSTASPPWGKRIRYASDQMIFGNQPTSCAGCSWLLYLPALFLAMVTKLPSHNTDNINGFVPNLNYYSLHMVVEEAS